MSWQDVQWEQLQFDATSLKLPDPEPITPRPLSPHTTKNAYIRHHLQLRGVSVCSALCFILGMILLLSAGANPLVRIVALVCGLLWLLLLVLFFLIKASMERKEQGYKKAEQKWLDWERRAYKAGLTPQQQRLLDSLLRGENPVADEKKRPLNVKAKRELSVRVQQQASE